MLQVKWVSHLYFVADFPPSLTVSLFFVFFHFSVYTSIVPVSRLHGPQSIVLLCLSQWINSNDIGYSYWSMTCINPQTTTCVWWKKSQTMFVAHQQFVFLSTFQLWVKHFAWLNMCLCSWDIVHKEHNARKFKLYLSRHNSFGHGELSFGHGELDEETRGAWME